MYDCPRGAPVGRFRISDDHPLGRACTVAEIMVHSSNIATAHIADADGRERLQAFLRELGFHEPAPIELNERARTLPRAPTGAGATMTVGFGHGIAITPLHLASAYAALVNGGILRPATLIRVGRGHRSRGPPRLSRGDQLPDPRCCG